MEFYGIIGIYDVLWNSVAFLWDVMGFASSYCLLFSSVSYLIQKVTPKSQTTTFTYHRIVIIHNSHRGKMSHGDFLGKMEPKDCVKTGTQIVNSFSNMLELRQIPFRYVYNCLYIYIYTYTIIYI